MAKTTTITSALNSGGRHIGAGLLAIGAGSVLTNGIATGAATVAFQPDHPNLTPIVAAEMRLSELSAWRKPKGGGM